jgi:hypothetical protein
VANLVGGTTASMLFGRAWWGAFCGGCTLELKVREERNQTSMRNSAPRPVLRTESRPGMFFSMIIFDM